MAGGRPPPRNLFDDLRQIAEHLAAAYQRFADGAARWLEENQEGITAFLAEMQILAVVQPELERLHKKWEGTAWGHLLEEIDFASAFALMLILDRGQEEVVDEVLEPVLTDAEFLASVEEAVLAGPLPNAHRRQLQKGLEFMGQQDYELAVPLLINPLEGAFWKVAQDRELVERIKGRMQFTAESGKEGHPAKGVEAIFEPLGIDRDFHSFLVHLVYGTTGNPYRHGTAEEHWRRTGLMLAVALVGWLDLYADTEERGLLHRAFARKSDAVDRALELLPPLAPVAANARRRVEPTINILMGAHALQIETERARVTPGESAS